MDFDTIVSDQIGRKDNQVGAAGMAQRGKQKAAQPGCDDQVRELPGWRDFPIHPGDLTPGAVPFLPGVAPVTRIEPLREVGHLGKRDFVGGQRGGRGDPRSRLVFLECSLG